MPKPQEEEFFDFGGFGNNSADFRGNDKVVKSLEGILFEIEKSISLWIVSTPSTFLLMMSHRSSTVYCSLSQCPSSMRQMSGWPNMW